MYLGWGEGMNLLGSNWWWIDAYGDDADVPDVTAMPHAPEDASRDPEPMWHGAGLSIFQPLYE